MIVKGQKLDFKNYLLTRSLVSPSYQGMNE